MNLVKVYVACCFFFPIVVTAKCAACRQTAIRFFPFTAIKKRWRKETLIRLIMSKFEAEQFFISSA